MATDRELIDACNTLCEHIGKAICPGYEIVLRMRIGEAEIALLDISGNEIETDSPDYGVSTVRELCMASFEHQAAHQ
jgi:hypothetical protein